MSRVGPNLKLWLNSQRLRTGQPSEEERLQRLRELREEASAPLIVAELVLSPELVVQERRAA